MTDLRYTLTAASAAVAPSLANVPINLFNLVMSIPAWEVEAMGRLADAMVATGSWQVWGPTNVFGFDEQDPPKLEAIIDMLMPVEPVSSILGKQLSWWARANLPMNAGCAAAQGACPDPKAMLDSMFTVPAAELFRGYQFPTVTNPFTGEQTSWSGQYVKLDPGGPATALREYLTGQPVGVKTVTPAEALATMSRLAKSFNAGFYPFVQNSQWFDSANTMLAPVFRALAPVLCEACEANPYDNPWLKNYPPEPAAQAPPPAVSPSAAVVATTATDSATRTVDVGPPAAPAPAEPVAPAAPAPAEPVQPAVVASVTENPSAEAAGTPGTTGRHRREPTSATLPPRRPADTARPQPGRQLVPQATSQQTPGQRPVDHGAEPADVAHGDAHRNP